MPLGDLLEISKISQSLQEGTLVGVCPFFVKLQPGMAYKKAKVKVTWATLSKRDAYTETLTQVLSYRFWRNYEHDFASARLPLK